LVRSQHASLWKLGYQILQGAIVTTVIQTSMIQKPLNRQAKVKGSDDWIDMGPVSFEDAAVSLVQRQGLVADKLFVTVRDDQDLTEFDLTIESFRGFRVTGLRGGV
jgi:phosphate uptake regulator